MPTCEVAIRQIRAGGAASNAALELLEGVGAGGHDVWSSVGLGEQVRAVHDGGGLGREVEAERRREDADERGHDHRDERGDTAPRS